MKIIINDSQLKRDTKAIKKKSNLKHTEVLDKLVTCYGYTDHDEYRLDKKASTQLVSLSSLDVFQLSKIQQKIESTFNVDCETSITKEIAGRVENYRRCNMSFMASKEIAIYPIVNKLKTTFEGNSIINDRFFYSNESILLFCNLLMEKYNNSPLNKKDLISIFTTKSMSVNDKSIAKEYGLYELIKYTRTESVNNNYEDFILPIIIDFFDKTEDLNPMAEKIRSRIELERKYIFEVTESYASPDDVCLNFPILSTVHHEIGDFNMSFLSKFKSMVSSYIVGFKSNMYCFASNLYLHEKHRSSFSKQDSCEISKSELNQNVCFTGNVGSGISQARNILLLQAITNGSGFIAFIDDMQHYGYLYSMIKGNDSNESICVYSIEQLNDITEKMIKSFVLNKKKVIIISSQAPLCFKEENEILNRFSVKLMTALSKIKNHHREPFIVALGFIVVNYDIVTSEVIHSKIDLMNMNNHSVLMFDYYSDNKNIIPLLDKFKHIFIGNSPSSSIYLNDRNEDLATNLGVGCFFNMRDVSSVTDVYMLSTYKINEAEHFHLDLPVGYS